MSFVRDKVALVTGGATGIGLCMIKELFSNGLRGVTIADVDANTGEEVSRALSEKYGAKSVLFVKTDVTQPQDVEAAFEKTAEFFGNLDIVINSAGIFDDRLIEKTIAINLSGTLRTCLLAMDRYLPQYRSGSEAVIVNMSSICGVEAFGNGPVYGASKFGVTGVSRCLGTKQHYERTGVRVLTLCPGLTDTAILADTDSKYVNLSYRDVANDKWAGRPKQQPEVVAEALPKIINEGETGSFWVIEGGITQQVQFPDLLKSYAKDVNI